MKQTVTTIVEVPNMKYLTAVLVSGEAPPTGILTRRGKSGLVSTVRLQQWWQCHTKTTVHLRMHAEFSLFSLMKESAAPSPRYQRLTFKEANNTFLSENEHNVLNKWYSGLKWLKKEFFFLLCSISIRINKHSLCIFLLPYMQKGVTHMLLFLLYHHRIVVGERKKRKLKTKVQNTQIA